MKQKNIIAIFFSLILAMFLGGCSLMSSESQKQPSFASYFSSPDEAIPIITKLLKKEDFATLANYYDLSKSGINRADLESGDFFIRKKRPEVAHPAGFWRYKHPFPPGFKYSGMSPGPGEDVYTIDVMIVIDQGTGSPSQVGYDSFYMTKSTKGWQILPDPLKEKEASELPSMAPEKMPNLPSE